MLPAMPLLNLSQLFLVFLLLLQPAHAATVAYWNFNDLSIASSSSPGSGGAPTSIAANSGSGTLSLTTWNGTLNDYAGSSLNTLNSDAADTSLSLIADSSGDGSSIVLSFSMTGLLDPTLSFATQGTSTGFDANQLAYSTNGTDFTNIGSTFSPESSYSIETFDLSSVDTLDNTTTAYLQITFDGATGSTGNNRIDNLQITAIPEPTSLLLAALSLTLLLSHRQRDDRRRR